MNVYSRKVNLFMNNVRVKFFQNILQVPSHCWCQFKPMGPIGTCLKQKHSKYIYNNFLIEIRICLEKEVTQGNLILQYQKGPKNKKNELKGQLILE